MADKPITDLPREENKKASKKEAGLHQDDLDKVVGGVTSPKELDGNTA